MVTVFRTTMYLAVTGSCCVITYHHAVLACLLVYNPCSFEWRRNMLLPFFRCACRKHKEDWRCKQECDENDYDHCKDKYCK
jgi:hypothetical protein